GPLLLSGHHRYHHIHYDKYTYLHSPKNCIFQSHVGWVFESRSDHVDPLFTKDWVMYPELVWIDKFEHVSFAIYLVGL
ncbi:acyl-CoA desaturase, partial [Francisella tularensis subsp. holarctica]|nr:acyl-CoA desaturase [Francisella tularensis subsp. holarctica]